MAFRQLLIRDLRLYRYQPGSYGVPMVFFIVMMSLFPIILGPLLATLWAAAVIWIALSMALLLSLETVFRVDYKSRYLDLLVLSGHSLPGLLFAKSLAHWLAIGLPLWLLASFSAVLLGVKGSLLLVLCFSIGLGIPTISLLGNIGALLTVGLSQGGLLLSVIMVPLIIPVLIFGVSSTLSVHYGLSPRSSLLWLSALLFLAVGFAPLVSSITLKVATE